MSVSPAPLNTSSTNESNDVIWAPSSVVKRKRVDGEIPSETPSVADATHASRRIDFSKNIINEPYFNGLTDMPGPKEFKVCLKEGKLTVIVDPQFVVNFLNAADDIIEDNLSDNSEFQIESENNKFFLGFRFGTQNIHKKVIADGTDRKTLIEILESEEAKKDVAMQVERKMFFIAERIASIMLDQAASSLKCDLANETPDDNDDGDDDDNEDIDEEWIILIWFSVL